MFDTILFPVDFSKRGAHVARSVAAYARQFNSRVVLLHVVEMPDLLFGMPEYNVISFDKIRENQVAAGREKLETWGQEEFEGIPVRRRIVSGDAATEIASYADEEHASIIMMASHGVGPFRRFMIGSTAAKVLHDSHVPVWTDVHSEDVSAQAAGPLKSLVCAIDLGPQSESALRMAAAVAEKTSADVTIVHAIPTIDDRPGSYFDFDFTAQLSAEAKERIGELQSKAGTDYRVCVHGGDPAEVVQKAASAHSANLVVIARGAILGGLGRLRTHSYAIVNKSQVPVLSV
jgi:nucleotide-binding universal stress UspA family protein